MPFWNRRLPAEVAPGWAYPLAGEASRTLVAIVRETLRELGATEVGEERNGTIEVVPPDGSPISVGLTNLAQIVASEPEARWKAIARGQFAALLDPDGRPESAAEAVPALRLRLLPAGYSAMLPKVRARPVAPGLDVGLFVDLPRTVVSVNTDNLARWGLAEDRAWSLAEANTRRERVDVDRVSGPGDTELRLLQGEHFFAATHALWLDEHVPCDPELGALVGIPSRHAVGAHAIRSMEVAHVVPVLAQWTQDRYRAGPGSVSPELYWWCRGRFVPIPVEFSDSDVTITPPDEFTAVLELLARR
jgi:hypothetical protein